MFIRKFFHFSIGPMAAAALSFFTTPLISWLIMPEEFGKTELYMTIYNMLLICINMGMDQSFVRFFSQCSSEKEKVHLFRQSIILPLINAIAILVLLSIFWKPCSLFLFNQELFLPVLILGGTLLLGIMNYYSMLVLRMQQKGKAYSFLNLLQSLCNSLFIILFSFTINRSFLSIVLAQSAALFITLCLAIYSQKKYWFLKLQESSIFNFMELFKFGIPFLPSLVIFWVFSSTSSFSLRFLSSFEELGVYSVSFKFVAILALFQKSFGTFWVPVAYETYKKHPENKVFFERVFSIISLGIFTAAAFIILFKELILKLLHSNYVATGMVMPFLLLIPVSYTLSEITVIGINFKKKSYWHIVIAFIAAATNIILSYFLVPVFGAKGAAISCGVSYCIFFLIRTMVSKIYYPINYNLIKTGILLLVIISFATYSTFISFCFYHTIAGLFIFLIIFLLYYPSIKYLFGKGMSFLMLKFKKADSPSIT